MEAEIPSPTWRKLAEPTYAVSENGRCEKLPAGTRLQLMDLVPGVEPVPGADMALQLLGPGTTIAWYVTASALVFAIGIGDKIEHLLVPGFAMTVLEIEPCEPPEDHGGAPAHDQYKIVDPEGHEDWLCAHVVRRVE